MHLANGKHLACEAKKKYEGGLSGSIAPHVTQHPRERKAFAQQKRRRRSAARAAMSFRVLLRSCALLACAAWVSAWTTTTQARFGTSLSRIVNESNGIGTGNTQGSLGYLWSLPASSTDHTGLGGSITWHLRLRQDRQERPRRVP